MSNEINVIIEKLCEKLGTSAQFLIPELAKLNIAINIYTIIACIIAAVVLAALGMWGVKNRKDEFDTTHEIIAIVAFVCCVIAVVLVIVAGCDLIGWFVSPEAMAFKQIIDTLK